MNRYFLMIIFVLVVGCVHTRDPQTIPISQSNDEVMTCEQIQIEYASNTEIAAAKIKKNNSNDTQDAIVGFLIWPGLADFKNADGVKGNSLIDRNIRLKNIALQKGCNLSSYPEQPSRYI